LTLPAHAVKQSRRGMIFSYCSIPESRIKLEKLGDELNKTLEKIYKSEKVINSNMSEVGTEYSSKSE
jgi:hypothetical protein